MRELLKAVEIELGRVGGCVGGSERKGYRVNFLVVGRGLVFVDIRE